jgi:RsiW-degrading membrane proteinase PrsW (M82 family)
VTEIAKIPLSLIPVLAFLASLLVMDSFKLVSTRAVLRALAAGALAAGASLLINVWALGMLEGDVVTLRRYVAPVTEEILKALYIAFLIRSHRVGFLVDAAIYGFAVGTGFALVENSYYLTALERGGILLWIARGFGTAILHGSTTGIFAMLAKLFVDRRESGGLHLFLPGLGVAMVIHSVFNHVPIHPLAMAAALLIVMPVLVIVVFQRSEEATRRWLGVGLDEEVELLELILSGEIRNDRIGRYLQSLRRKFPGTVVADMLCLLQLHVELSIRAKGILIAREAGLKLPVDDRDRANLEELRFLEKSVGKTGLLAVNPILRRSRKDLWQLYVLGGS